jgi:threonine dehydrogenase-like Zn-dependent dehydrogenase
MKALQLQFPGQVDLVDVEIPAIRDDELLVRTGAATICTSDLNDIRSNPFGIRLPVVLGHEASGTVAALGAAVSGFRVGDRLATHPVHPCGSCAMCRKGWGHLCRNMGHFGINRPGTFAEYYVVRADRARRLPAGIDFALASLAEPVCVCLEALAQARLPPGEALLVIGDGPFGLLIARLAAAQRRLTGNTSGNIQPAARLVVAGHSDFRLSFARQALALNTAQLPDPVEALLEVSGGQGFAAAILAVGSAPAFREGLACLRPKGRLVVFSALPGETPVDLFAVHLKELEIVGACNDQERLDDAVQLLSTMGDSLSDLITHRLPLSAYRWAFDLAGSRPEEALKVSFVF